MNNLSMIGRLTKDPEIRYSSGNPPVAYGSYTLAVDRPSKGENKITDFIYCKVVGKTAEFTEKYLRKGMKIAITGRIQVDNYKDQDGNNRSTTYVHVLGHEFCESKSSDSQGYTPTPAPTSGDGFMSMDLDDSELPFS